ncbi:hypothetical protein [Stigmatella aurantiaca]|uniref:Uncharacterized protein n=1 Tax=Stigmatella aurantiaca (strain DW4/3-1) TaxID=378806 RepID=Q08R48_STIAD|nr:hypothetical protein [Stigmatella aurantiaca]ADO70949.1 uncharacterized protein STAUR_3157 [Stigmatella aurantiaca DW4/3-1]EAU62959.1 hypothetical protein STIAU_4487 [Stigmatella aurantiaca DW4/3-1]
MSAESLGLRCVLLCCAAWLAMGCGTLTSRAVHGRALGEGLHSPRVLRNTAGGVLQGEVSSSSSEDSGAAERLRRRRGPKRDQGAVASQPVPDEVGGGKAASCGGQAVPAGWPHVDSSQEVLAPFLACASPAEFVAMQQGVDMARLVESLKDWDAVRLGALGPMDAKASEVLTRKRAAFLVTATEKYGVALAEVFALFILHTAFDDELREVVWLLAREKQLGETLGSMATVREELQRRGLELSEYPERAERGGDVLRGLGRASRDVLATIPLVAEPQYTDFSAKRGQLPPPYQEALHEVERALMAQHFSPGSVALGSFDALTFGVPLGFYHLAAGAGHGASSLAQGKYEQATRELAPAALMVALYAGGKGARFLSEATDAGRSRLRWLPLSESGLDHLKAVVARLKEQGGVNATRELFRYIQANRESALVAAQWGEAGVLALYEARGNATKAQAVLAEASRERPGATSTSGGVGKGGSTTAALLHEVAGFEQDALRAKWLQVEKDAPGTRLSADVAKLKKHRPSMDAPPQGAAGHPLWGEYVVYWERRLAELERGVELRGPWTWVDYQKLRGLFIRGLAFERTMVSMIQADAALPQPQRRWLQDFNRPRIETHVGVVKADLRFADVLVIEEQPPMGQRPRVETFSFKSRDLRGVGEKALTAQMMADASDALRYYGETLNIRRPGLEMEAQVQRIRLIYEGGELKPSDPKALKAAVRETQNEVEGVEVSFQ